MNKKTLLALFLGVYIFMATIVIPSKHIYDMRNEKVIDNQIDKVEVLSNTIEIINGTENVYNISYDEPFVEGDAQYNIGIGSILSYSDPSEAVVPGKEDAFFAYVSLKPTYITKYIEIPKTQDNARIVKLLTGASKETGSPIISVSFFGSYERGIVKAQAGGNLNDYGRERIWDIKNFLFFDEETENNISYNLPYTDEEIEVRYNKYSHVVNPDDYTWAVAKIRLKNEDNLLSATASTNYNSFGIELKILCGIELIKIGACVPVNRDAGQVVTIYTEVSGTYERYIPKDIRISFEGDIIKLDLEENTITIGDGNNVISFTGNELMQTTNMPPVEYMYRQVIDNYKNGKETATIRCGIEDYFDINTRFAKVEILSKTFSINEWYVTIRTAEQLKIGEQITIDGKTFTVYSQGSYSSPYEYGLRIYYDGYLDLSGEYTVVVEGGKLISKTGDSNIPMTFHIGDKVVPYKYSANGKDIPMSLNKDGTAKIFAVIGNKMIYDGAVWQELSLQEWNEPIKRNEAIITIKRGGTLGTTSQVFCVLKYGKLEIGDGVEYDGEFGYVESYSNSTGEYALRLAGYDKFYNSIGKTITINVTKIDATTLQEINSMV